MADRTFDQIFKAVIVALATVAVSGTGYLTLVVVKNPDLETKFEKQDELIRDVKTTLLSEWNNTITEIPKQAKEIKLLKEEIQCRTQHRRLRHFRFTGTYYSHDWVH